MGNIPSKPVVVNQEWTNGVTKLNQTNLTSGVNQNITNIKTAVDGIIDALGGPGTDPKNFEEITWADLKALRDASQLVPGKQYRITDYLTAVEQPECRSAGHPFDIIVTALTSNTLSEDAKAAVRDGDEYFMKLSPSSSITNASWKPGITISDIEALYKVTDGEGDYSIPIVKSRTFTQMGTMVNPATGVEVPYLFEPDPDGGGESSDFDRRYLFVGEYEFNGVIYSQWEECYVDGTPVIFGGRTYYELTNVVVDCERSFVEKVKLSAWKLKYCLDNDYDRFGFAVRHDVIQINNGGTHLLFLRYPSLDGDDGLAWLYVPTGDSREIEDPAVDYDNIDGPSTPSDVIYTATLSVSIGDELDMAGDPVTVVATRFGKGVIYEMEDEWGNKLPYDFKNVQFKRYKVTQDTSAYDGFDGKYVGCKDVNISMASPKGYKIEDDTDFKWCYTFNWYNEDGKSEDYTIVGNLYLSNDEGFIPGCYKNVFGVYMINDTDVNRMYLGNNVIWDDYKNDGGYSYGFYSNTVGNNCYYNTVGKSFQSNIVGNDFCQNTVESDFCQNTVESGFFSNTVGYGFSGNIVGNNFDDNTVGYGFSGNIVENTFSNNIVGNNFSNNTVGNNFQNNTLGNSFKFNTIGNRVYKNTVGNNFMFNTLGNDMNNNGIGDGFQYNSVGNDFASNTVGNSFKFNTVGVNFTSNTLGEEFGFNIVGIFSRNNTVGNKFEYNIVGNNFRDNKVRDNFSNNTVGNKFISNTVGNYFAQNTVGNYFAHNTVGNYVEYSSMKDGVIFITLDAPSGSWSKPLQYITIGPSLKGASSQNPLIITPIRDAEYEQEYISANKVVRQV